MANDLTIKEIFERIIDFKSCPRTLKWEMGFLSKTMTRWYEEGLPRNENNSTFFDVGIHGDAYPLPNYNAHEYTGRERSEVSARFDLDEGFMGVPVNCWFEPPFEEVTYYEDETIYEKQDSFGIRKRNYKDESSMPHWVGFPVKTREDWEQIKEERLTFKGIQERTYPGIDIEKHTEDVKSSNVPLMLNYYPIGYFGSLRYLLGDEELLKTYYDDPDLLKDMADHLTNLWLAIDEEQTAEFDFDVLYFWEDMSYKQGSLISPAMIREFMLPYYKKIIDFGKSKGINHVYLDTDGLVDELIPVFSEVGVDLFTPMERRAGNDIIKYRKKYPNMMMMGGFDKSVFLEGRDAIDRELEVMRELIKFGGFVPHVDHWVPHNVSWDDFIYYREKLNSIIDSTQVL